MCLAEPRGELERALCRGKRVRDRDRRWHVAVERGTPQRRRVCEPGVSERVARIAFDRLLEIPDRALQRSLRTLVKMMPAEQVQVVRIEALRCGRRRGFALSGAPAGPDRREHRTGDLALKPEDVVE